MLNIKPRIKHRLLLLLCLTVIGLGYYGCRKDAKTQSAVITDPVIAQAKTWYETTYPIPASSKSSLATQNIPVAVKATGDLSQLI